MVHSMKKFFRNLKNKKILNGTDGVISIFLALLLVSFTVLSDSLVEVSRFHAVSGALDELMDSSASSTLAHYDSYLLDRFGLMATGQDKDVETVYKSYLDENLKNGNIAWNNQMTSVSGEYPLSDAEVLLKQIEEISKYTVPTDIAGDLTKLGLDKLLSGISGAGQFSEYSSMISAGADAVGSLADVVGSLKKLFDETKRMNTLKSDYDQKYSDFKTGVEQLAGAISIVTEKENELSAAKREVGDLVSSDNQYTQKIKELDDKLKELQEKYDKNEIDEEAYEKDKKIIEDKKKDQLKAQSANNKDLKDANNKVTLAEVAVESAKNDVQSKINTVNETSSAYASAISNLKDSLTKCGTLSEDVLSKLEGFASSTVNAGNTIADGVTNLKYDHHNEIAALEKEQKVREEELKTLGDSDGSEIVRDQYESTQQLLDYYKNDQTASDQNAQYDNIATSINASIDGSATVIEEALKGYNKNILGKTVEKLDKLYTKVSQFQSTSVTADTVISSSEYYVAISGFASLDDINNARSALDKEFDEEGKNKSFFAFVKGSSEMMKSLLNVNIFYNPSLDAVVNPALMAASPAGSSLGDRIIAFITAVSKLSNTSSMSLEEKIQTSADVFNTASALNEAIITETTMIFNGIVDATTNFYDKLLLAEYLNTTCANRTTYMKSNPYTGYSFASAGMGTSANEIDDLFMIGAFSAAINAVAQYGSGNSDIFCGAETEYLLYGSRVEILNQSHAFLDIYLIRLLCDLQPILNDPQVESIATAASAFFGVGEVVVWLIYFLAEPFLDTMFICNGNKIDFWKSCVYLTPSGIPTLISRVMNFKLNDAQKTKIIKAAADSNKVEVDLTEGAKGDSGTFFVFGYSDYLLVGLLIRDKITLTKRFGSIIYLESKNKNSNFEITKAYTYLHSKVNGEYKPFLPPASVYTNYMFSGTKEHVRGY